MSTHCSKRKFVKKPLSEEEKEPLVMGHNEMELIDSDFDTVEVKSVATSLGYNENLMFS